MEIIDAQMHQVAPLSWEFDEESKLAASAELTREAMDCVGVDAALLHARLEFCEHAIGRYPNRFAGCVIQDPKEPELEQVLADLQTRPGIRAVRAMLIDFNEPQPTLNDDYRSGAFEPLFGAAEKLGLPVFVFATGQAAAIADIARNHPDLNLVVDHLGLRQPPMLVAEDPWAHLPVVLALARFPNVAIKFTGAQTLSRRPYPHADIWPHLQKVIDAFGPERLMWGADMTRLRFKPGTIEPAPRDRWAGIYSDALNYLRDTNELSVSDKEQIFSGTIRRILHWT